jgi:hypothetical protein
MNRRVTLDVPSFQKLLLAAWVLQCERDRELAEAATRATAETQKKSAASSLSVLTQRVSEQTRGVVREARKRLGLGWVWIEQGSKQLAASASSRIAAAGKRGWRIAQAYTGARLVLVLLVTLFLSQLRTRPRLTDVIVGPQFANAAVDTRPIERAAPSEEMIEQHARRAAPLVEPSHLRVTDAPEVPVVESLSRYEIRSLKRQAQYGDDVAALTLGMAYEVGRPVRQSCKRAAHWVALAAEDGNPAAQYNLALRYANGDGTRVDRDEARKWIERAATRGYKEAETESAEFDGGK